MVPYALPYIGSATDLTKLPSPLGQKLKNTLGAMIESQQRWLDNPANSKVDMPTYAEIFGNLQRYRSALDALEKGRANTAERMTIEQVLEGLGY
jgi:hypothetical protein